MPRGDRKGPLGLGPGTRKGRGLCKNQNQVSPFRSGGLGQGAGRGARASCRRISGFGMQPDQVEILKKRIGFFEKRIEDLKKLIGRLESGVK
ncbi:MAG: hypothetical protein XD84_2183 [Desulfotomaculum sp. 46_80]|nr:MAG: hypothetical protein XD84_2183 [Desulfotomaculum sp. 46_80]HAU32219.1 hypothetical protein [Desulfotomaculum sp.]